MPFTAVVSSNFRRMAGVCLIELFPELELSGGEQTRGRFWVPRCFLVSVLGDAELILAMGVAKVDGICVGRAFSDSGGRRFVKS